MSAPIEYYPLVRNLDLLAGRFFDAADVQQRQHVALMMQKLAQRLYGNQEAAIGKTIKLHGMQFTVIGTFREKVDDVRPVGVNRQQRDDPDHGAEVFRADRADRSAVYVQARSMGDVDSVTNAVRAVLEGRHRPGARYGVANLTCHSVGGEAMSPTC